MGRAGLGGEIQKVKKTQGEAVAASRGCAGRLEELGSLTGECAGGWRRLSPVLRVGVVPAGSSRAEGGQETGQGPALGLLAARGIGPGL